MPAAIAASIASVMLSPFEPGVLDLELTRHERWAADRERMHHGDQRRRGGDVVRVVLPAVEVDAR